MRGPTTTAGPRAPRAEPIGPARATRRRPRALVLLVLAAFAVAGRGLQVVARVREEMQDEAAAVALLVREGDAYEGIRQDRSDRAAVRRLAAQAAHHEAVRRTRSDRAAAARLEAQAAHHEAIRRTRSDRAAAARLEAAARHHGVAVERLGAA